MMNIEIRLLKEDDKQRCGETMIALLKEADNDFVPPLSKRTSTTDSVFKKDDGREFSSSDGVLSYYEKMKEQGILGAFDGDRLVGFVSFIENYESENVRRGGVSNIYISTLVLSPAYRGLKITPKLYQFLFEELYSDREVYTRTWSENKAHIGILLKFGFSELTRIPNDRGENIDTVYFVKRAFALKSH